VKIAFIGCGNMARSLIGGLIANGQSPTNITVADPSEDATHAAAADWGVTVADNNQQAVQTADVVVLAVKPQKMKAVLTDVADTLSSQLLISLAAGILSKDMLAWSQVPNNKVSASEKEIALIRCMPNTPALLQAGATGLYANSSVSNEQRSIAETILNAVGTIAWVEQESQLDAITALSGSGPAYFFLMIESMTEAAVQLGLAKETATQFAIQTALGAARMAAESGTEPAELRQNVTSPAGTTEAALNNFTNNNFKQIVLSAMQAADKRAQELGKELGDSDG